MHSRHQPLDYLHPSIEFPSSGVEVQYFLECLYVYDEIIRPIVNPLHEKLARPPVDMLSAISVNCDV